MSYSPRRTAIGSTRVARRAGTIVAASAATARSTAPTAKLGRSVWADAVEKAIERARRQQGAAETECHATADEHGAVSNDHEHDIVAGCAECHAHTEFAGTQSYTVRDHAIHANRRHHEGDDRERCDDGRGEPLLTGCPIDNGRHRPHVINRLVGIGSTNLRHDRADESRRVAVSAYDQRHPILGTLQIAPVHLRTRIHREPVVANVAGDADNRYPGQRRDPKRRTRCAPQRGQ